MHGNLAAGSPGRSTSEESKVGANTNFSRVARDPGPSRDAAGIRDAVGRRLGDANRRRPTAHVTAMGQGIVEYGIIIGLTALFIVISLAVFGDQIGALVAWIGSLVP